MSPWLMGAADAAAAWLVRTSIETSVLILLVVAVRWLLGRHLSPRSRAALWLLVVARLALPSAPASPASVFNVGYAVGIPVPVLSPPAPRSAVDTAMPPPVRSGPPLRRLLLMGWAGVAILLVGRLGWRSLRLGARVGGQRALTHQETLELLEDARQELRVRVPVSVVVSDQVDTPALFGFIRPRLLLPEHVLDSFSPAELRLMFMHELAHVRRRDVLVGWAATTVHVLHWFNPLVGYALARLRADRELATDSLVLSHCAPGENRAYGEVLIRLLELAANPGLLPGTVGVLEDKTELTRRVTMIAAQAHGLYRWSALAAVVMALMAVTTFTRAQPPAGDVPSVVSTETAPAVEAAKQWLAIVDRGDYDASWDEACAAFRQAVGRADWASQLAQVRRPLGTVATRTITSADRRASLPGAPDGDYVVVTTTVTFDRASSPAVETCTMRREDDGVWRAAGYFVRPAAAEAMAPRPQSDIDTAPAEAALASWLALVDVGSYAESWDAASPRVRTTVGRDAWSQALRSARAPLGAVLNRKTQSAKAYASLPGAGDGPFVVVQLQSSFEKKKAAAETCTLARDGDGQWRAAGYFIR